MGDLKPCPFCGGDASYWWRGSRYGLIGFVKCDICDAQTRCTNLKGKPEDEGFDNQVAFKKLTNLWNSRV